MFNNNSTSAATAIMPALYQDQKKQRVFYEQQLKKLLKKIEVAEDLDTVKRYIKEQGLVK
jgi:hypothetical protein